MDAEKAREIVAEFERNGVTDRTLSESTMANVARYDRAKAYLSALEGPEVKALVDAAKHLLDTGWDCHPEDIFCGPELRKALVVFKKAVGK